MADPFLGEIRAFTWNFAPRGWAFCNGALLPITQNSALFALLGVSFGGNGTSNFGLPDLRGRTMMHMDGTNYLLGQSSGSETVALTTNMMPTHSHVVVANGNAADKARPDPGPYYLAQANLPGGTAGPIYAPFDPANALALAPTSIAMSGGGTPHANMQPFLALNFCIALAGIFPARS